MEDIIAYLESIIAVENILKEEFGEWDADMLQRPDPLQVPSPDIMLQGCAAY